MKPNEDVPLYGGPIRVLRGTHEAAGEGTVTLRWRPTPRVQFQVPGFVGLGPSMSTARVELTDRGWSCSGRITSEGRGGLSGVLNHFRDDAAAGFTRQSVGDVTAVRFSVPNFHRTWGPPVVGSASGWRITLGSDDSEACESLETAGGFAFTHSLSIERADRATFAPTSATDLARFVNLGLSFCLGRWTGCCMAVGLGEDGDSAWEQWCLPWMSPYKYEHSWFPKQPSNAFAECVRGFVESSVDRDLERALRRCVHWYVEANGGNGGLEGSITMALIALELLAWLEFVNRRGGNATVFDKAQAHTKIREYLQFRGIPVATTALPHLMKFVADPSEPCADGLEALTRIRNRTVHPPKASGFKEYSMDMVEEAWRLSLYLLERSVLAEIGYKGPMVERLGWSTIEIV